MLSGLSYINQISVIGTQRETTINTNTKVLKQDMFLSGSTKIYLNIIHGVFTQALWLYQGPTGQRPP